MKRIKPLVVATLVTAYLASPALLLAADKKAEGKPKPYPLKTCIVADDKLDADAYVFVHNGQEIKLCCESCKGDFDKEPAKFLKKLEKPAKK
ncbi:MAG: hypothetical protein AB1705_12440 [Verrucomicrobiota bacterium]